MTKSLFSLSFYLIESHLGSKKTIGHATTVLREDSESNCKMEKGEVRAVMKYLCEKGMTPKEIYEHFMKTHENTWE